MPLALANLQEQYKNIDELTNKNFETIPPSPGFSHINDYRSPEEINKNIISIKKGQLSSSATNVLISLAFTAIVASAIFTGGLSLGVLSVVALGVTATKIGMDIYLAKKEKELNKEFFESKVLHKMNEQEIEIFKKLENPQTKTLFIAKKALDLNDNKNEFESGVKKYLLEKRQGYIENAKMRNTQLALGVLGTGIWLTISFVTAGIAGIAALGAVTLLAVGTSIINTEKVQNILGPNITEWFRNFTPKNKVSESQQLDYKNREINEFINKLKQIDIKQIVPPISRPCAEEIKSPKSTAPINIPTKESSIPHLSSTSIMYSRLGGKGFDASSLQDEEDNTPKVPISEIKSTMDSKIEDQEDPNNCLSISI